MMGAAAVTPADAAQACLQAAAPARSKAKTAEERELEELEAEMAM